MKQDYEKFGKAIWDVLKANEMVFVLTEDNDIADIAVECGLAKKLPYDPEKMGCMDADPGEEVYYWGEDLDQAT